MSATLTVQRWTGLDLRFLRGVEHARSSSFQPFAVQPLLNTAQHLADLERRGHLKTFRAPRGGEPPGA